MFSVPVNLIRQHCFCPRIPFFTEVVGIKTIEPLWVSQGVSYHKIRENLSEKKPLKLLRDIGGDIEYRPMLESERLSMHGVPDAIILAETEVYIVEYKISAPTVVRGLVAQLAAYALLAEERYGLGCDKGLLISDKPAKIRMIKLSKAVKDRVLQARDLIWQAAREQLPPATSATAAKCTQCEFLNFCNDRF